MVWYSHLFQNFPQFVVYIRLVYIFVLYIIYRIYISIIYVYYTDSILVWLPNKFISLIIVNDLCKLIFKEYSFKLLL